MAEGAGVGGTSGGMGSPTVFISYASHNTDRAMYWLEHAYQQHDSGLLSMKHDPMLRNLENDPRYKIFLRKMKFPE
ncbi:MAG TPA: hypothetical protein VGL34_01305 [Steroidobacteraceae bacterium]|jgi:hypothetical protein